MLIVGVAAAEGESLLAAGTGPGLSAGARCPFCGGLLRGFWLGYERSVRFSRRVERLRIGRSRCRGCGRTRALLPSFVVPRRLDAAPVIGAALELAAAGRGHRPIAALLSLPATTVRGWLRRARARAGLVAARVWRLAQELGALAPRSPPGECPLAALLRAAGAAHAAAARRFGGAGLPDRFGLALCLLGEGLLGAQGLALGGRVGGGEDRRDRSLRWTGRCAMGGSGKLRDWREQEALFCYALIREAADERLAPRERGALVRALAGRPVQHPSGELRSPARSTLDQWIRAYRCGGFEALKPAVRCPGPRTPARLLEQAAALRRELPARTGGQIAEILRRLHGEQAPSARTIERYLRAHGLSRARLQGRERAYGRFEASAPNELWVADVLHGPLVSGRRAYLFCVLDDHSRFVVGARFAFAETTLALDGLLRPASSRSGCPIASTSITAPRLPPGSCSGSAPCSGSGSSTQRPAGPRDAESWKGCFARSATTSSSSWRGASSTRSSSSTASSRPGCTRPITAASTPRGGRRRSPATPRVPHAARTPATTPSSCAKPSSGARHAPSRRPRPSPCTATATRSTPPWSAAASSSSTTPSTSPESRSPTRAAPSGSPSHTRSTATPTRPRRASRPKPSRRRPPGSTTCACSRPSTPSSCAARSPTASFHPRRRHRDAQPAPPLPRLHPPTLPTADPRQRPLPLQHPPRGARPHSLRDRAGSARPPHRRGRLRQDRRRPRRRRHPRPLPAHDHLPRQPLDRRPRPLPPDRPLTRRPAPLPHRRPHPPSTRAARPRTGRARQTRRRPDRPGAPTRSQLEEIRLLTNTEMDSESPFAGILLGQPALRKRLRLGSFAALDQRLTLRYELPGMSPDQTAAYLHHHLTLAGRDDALFSDDAITLLHQTSRGIPRAINNLAVQALVAAYAEQKAIVDESSARAAITETTAE